MVGSPVGFSGMASVGMNVGVGAPVHPVMRTMTIKVSLIRSIFSPIPKVFLSKKLNDNLVHPNRNHPPEPNCHMGLDPP
jgi:hypothetical protein